MRQLMIGTAAVALCVAVAGPAFAKSETLKGTVVDQGCYAKNKAANASVDHKMPADVKDCAIACAKKGQPLALLTADGKVYQIAGALSANNNAKLVPHVGHTVEITGDAMEMGGSLMIHADDVKLVK